MDNTKSKESLKKDKEEELKNIKSNGKDTPCQNVPGSHKPTSVPVDKYSKNSKDPLEKISNNQLDLWQSKPINQDNLKNLK